jgi:hypothetical protein
MLLPFVLKSLNGIDKEHLVSEILELNNESRQYGLVLTPQNVVQILEARNRSLRQLGRIELGFEVSKTIIHNFCNSSYITPEEYVPVLSELHDIFYYMKNETEDKIGDDELIQMMKDYFENSCGGSLELLKGKLVSFAEDFRKKTKLQALPEED